MSNISPHLKIKTKFENTITLFEIINIELMTNMTKFENSIMTLIEILNTVFNNKNNLINGIY